MSPKKRIAYVSLNRFNTYLCDGVSNSTLDLLHFLKAKGHEVAVLTFFSDAPYKRQAFLHLASGRSIEGGRYAAALQGIPVHQEWLAFDEQALLDSPGHYLKAVTSKIREERVEIVLTSEDDFLTLFAVSALDVPGAHFFHSLAYIKHCRSFPLFIKLLTKRTLFAASRFLQGEVRTALGLEPELWYPLFDLDRLVVARPAEPAASLGYYSAGWHKGDPIVNRLVRMRPDWDFTVVGRNYGPPEGESPANLRALGDVPDLGNFYGRIGLLLVPSLVPEAFSRVILEAAANGIPVLANRIGGIPEAMGRSGILIDYEPDPASRPHFEELAGAYLREADGLFSKPERYQELSRLARQRAEAYRSEQDRLSLAHYERYFNR
ncbi:MAG: hypothetical protein A2Y56_10560 [Candidatus Aminicenantes bacterium RBG_13_63_10]|nr:MAG: hypothetical protein A2Y56_10560 [Candidatus Aminicenantes bacterium RBG_13_63_10]